MSGSKNSRSHDCENVIHLPSPTTDAVISALVARYFKDKIYTDCGKVLLAINPYTFISGLYSDEKVSMYRGAEGEALDMLRPHPWKIASQAVKALLKERVNEGDSFRMNNQSILISGESGAGKTETTKIIMNFLAAVGNVKSDQPSDVLQELGPVQTKVLQTNPILDALGNARTLRNDNSSRFGKYIQLYFDKSGELRGSGLSTFLLETPRVILQQPGERNFHIFYMMCSDINHERRKKYKVKSIHNYDYLLLSGGAVDRRDGVRDDVMFTQFLESLSVLGTDESTVDGLLRSIMAVLTVGNSSFVTSTNSAGDVVMHIDADCQICLSEVASLLGVHYESLVKELTTRTVVVNQEEFKVTLPQDQATHMRDVFAKTLYRAVFEWMVGFLNQKMSSSIADYGDDDQSTFGKIGLLDIFGFESLQLNSLEQLLINYANEHLQQHFDNTMIAAEQELYVDEGIEWSFVKFPSADECIRLISGSNIATPGTKKGMSILALLDEACIMPSGSDATFIRQIYSNVESQSRFASTNLHKGKGEFAVKHYAGVVVYNSKDFVVKNKNLHFPLDWLLKDSDQPYMRMLADTDGAIVTEKNMSPSKPQAAVLQESGDRVTVAGERRKSISMMRVATVSNTFCGSVDDLIRTINSTGVHYIKCFKPNDKQMKKNIMTDLISEQLICAGVIHTIRVTRTGFPVRFTYRGFYDRYYALMVSLIREVFDDTIDSSSAVRIIFDSTDEDNMIARETDLVIDVAQGIDIVVQRLQMAAMTGDLINPEEGIDPVEGPCIQRGKTTIFLRSPGYATLEFLYNKLLGARAAVIQGFARMLPVRANFLKAKRLVANIEILQLRRLLKRVFQRKLGVMRRFIDRCLYFAHDHFKLVRLSINVQRIYRRFMYRKRFWALIRFIRKVLYPVRRRLAGKRLARGLSAMFRRVLVLRTWKRTIRAINRFFRVCGRYVRRKIQERRQRAASRICNVLNTFICRKRFLKTIAAVHFIQKWIMFGPFRSYIEHKNYVTSLFEVAVVPLQKIWRWKSHVYKGLQLERERMRAKAMSSNEDNSSAQVFAKSSLVQQYMSSHLDNVSTPTAKILLRANKTPLWNLFCHYADKNITIPTAMDKKYAHGVLTRSALSKLFLDWGVHPSVMSIASIGLIVDSVMEAAVEKRQQTVQTVHSSPSPQRIKPPPSRLISYNNFCRILMLIALDLVQSPDLAVYADRDPRRPIMSVRSADAALSNPIHSPVVGLGMRWVLTAMDRSAGREKLSRSRASTLVSAFAGVLGAAAADTLDHNRPLSAKPKIKGPTYQDLKSGPMASDVIEMFRRNETTLVSMALHYSGTGSDSVRRSYYSLLDVMPAMSIVTTMKSVSEADESNAPTNDTTSPTIRRAYTMTESPAHNKMSPPKRSMTGSPLDSTPDVIENYNGFIPGKVQPVSTFRGALTERDNKRKHAVDLSLESLWKLLNDFGVCPDHCGNKTDLRRIYDLVREDVQSEDLVNGLNYVQFTEVLDLIGRNSQSTLASGSAANRLRCLFNSMNTSSGRNKVMTADRNALALPALKLCEEPTDAQQTSPAPTFAGNGPSTSRSSTPTNRRRSATPPPIRRGDSASSGGLRSRTPPSHKVLDGHVDNLRVLRSSSGGEVQNGHHSDNSGDVENFEAFVDAFAARTSGRHSEPRFPAEVGATPPGRNMPQVEKAATSARAARPLSRNGRAASMDTPRGGSRQPVTPSRQSTANARPSSAGRVGRIPTATRSDSGRTISSRRSGTESSVETTAGTERPSSAGRIGSKVSRSNSGNNSLSVDRKAPIPTRPASAGGYRQRGEATKAGISTLPTSVPRMVVRQPRQQPV